MSIHPSQPSLFSEKHLLSTLRKRGGVYVSGALLALCTLSFCSCKGDGHAASVDPLTRILFPPPPKQDAEPVAEPGIARTSEMQVAANPAPGTAGTPKGGSWWSRKPDATSEAGERFPESRTQRSPYVNPYIAARQPGATAASPAEALYQVSTPLNPRGGTPQQLAQFPQSSQYPQTPSQMPMQAQMPTGGASTPVTQENIHIAMVPAHTAQAVQQATHGAYRHDSAYPPYPAGTAQVSPIPTAAPQQMVPLQGMPQQGNPPGVQTQYPSQWHTPQQAQYPPQPTTYVPLPYGDPATTPQYPPQYQQYINPVQPQGASAAPVMPNENARPEPYRQPANDPIRGRFVDTVDAAQSVYRQVAFVQEMEPATDAEESDTSAEESADPAMTVKKK